MFLDYHNILWYYHHVIVFCATPIQAFQSVSEPHTLLSLYFSQQHHYAAEQWAVDFFVFEGTFSPAARMTPAMPSAGASIGVFIDLGVKDVDDDRRVVVLVQAEQDAVFITQLIGREGVAACHAGGQRIALGAFKEVLLHADQRQRR